MFPEVHDVWQTKGVVLRYLTRQSILSHPLQVFTDAGLVEGWRMPLVYNSRIGLATQTRDILCETELKLQSPLLPSGRAAR